MKKLIILSILLSTSTLFAADPVRISHPYYRMTGISYSKRNIYNVDYTRILMRENPEFSALGVTGRGIVWGTLADLTAWATLGEYQAAAIPLVDGVNYDLYSTYWSPLVGEANIIYTLRGYDKKVVKINVDTSVVTVVGSYDPGDGTVVANAHAIGFTEELDPADTKIVVDFGDAAKWSWSGEIKLSDGSMVTLYTPAACSADGKRWPQQGTGHAHRSPNKNWNATYGDGAGLIGTQDFSTGSGCNVLARVDTSYSTYPDESPTHSSWTYSNSWFVNSTVGAYNGAQHAPYLTTDHVYKVTFDPDVSPYFTYETLISTDTAGFWNTPIPPDPDDDRIRCDGSIYEWVTTTCNFHAQAWTYVRKDGNQIVYWSTDGKYSYDDFLYNGSSPWGTEGMFLYDLAPQVPPEPPSVTTASAGDLKATSVSSGGNITDDGGGTISWCGVAYATTPDPDLTDGYTTASCLGEGIFTSTVSGLAACSTYYLRAGVTNNAPAPSNTQWGENVMTSPRGDTTAGEWIGGSGVASSPYTIDHTKVTANLNDFPVYVLLSDARFKDTDNGGSIRPDGFDITFYSDVTRIPAERETYDGVTGTWKGWVMSNLSSVSDTIITVRYGDPTQTTDPNDDATYGKAAVWDANFGAVYHLSTGSFLVDSAGTYTLTNNGATGQAAAQIDGGTAELNGSSQYFSNASYAFTPGASVTLEWWQKQDTADVQASSAFTTTNDTQPDKFQTHAPYSDSNLYWDYGDITDGSGRVTFSYAAYLDKWSHVALVYNSATNLHAVYLDGEVVDSHTSATKTVTAYTGFQIGYRAAVGYHKASMDEFRISTAARSADWIHTQYHNQSDPATFAALGAEVPDSGAFYVMSAVIPYSVKDGSTALTHEAGTCPDDLNDNEWCWVDATDRLYVQTDGTNPGAITIGCNSSSVSGDLMMTGIGN
jgi:hypothetical protein